MSYEGTICPCGDKKPTNTMICDVCMSEYSQHPSMACYRDEKNDVENRRHAAQTLLSLARGRKIRREP